MRLDQLIAQKVEIRAREDHNKALKENRGSLSGDRHDQKEWRRSQSKPASEYGDGGLPLLAERESEEPEYLPDRGE